MALGSTASGIFNLVARESLPSWGRGFVLGIAGALLLAHFIRSMLFEVKPMDPLLFASVCGVLGGVAIAACTLPAWRATRVNPVVALRQESGRRSRPPDQALRWSRKNRAKALCSDSATDARSFCISSAGSGANARASATFRSMNSGFGMPRLARLTGSDRA